MVDYSKSHIEITDTRSKILAVANELFARQGFDGVSVRDIAQEAEVNVASINYHFKNKLNLFHEIFDYNYDWLDQAVTKISQKKGVTTKQVAVEMYELFQETGPALINCFNMVLNDHLCPGIETLKEQSKNQQFGPPGGEALLDVITREVGEKVPFERRDWGMRVLFTHIIHVATFINTTYLKNRCAQEEWMKDPAVQRNDMEELATAIIERLQKFVPK